MSDYKREVARLFDDVAGFYDRLEMFTLFSQQLINRLALTAERAVLDVAAGRGALLFPAAQIAGQVIGIDISEKMTAETHREILQRGLTHVRMGVMDAEHLAFQAGTFDVVLCGYALFFFEHPDRALVEMRRVLKPGGRLAVLTWGKVDERWKWVAQVIRKYLPPEFTPPRLWRAPGMLNKPEEVDSLVRAAGFQTVQQITESADLVYASAEDWWQQHRDFSARLPTQTLSPDDFTRYRNEIFAHLAAMPALTQQFISHVTLATP